MRFRTIGVLGLFAVTMATAAAPEAIPAHLKLAEKMVAEIKPDHNVYKNGKATVHWAGINGATVTENESDCTTYVTALLKTAYHLSASDFNAWANSASPSITKYYDCAVENKGLHGFKQIADVRPGDLLITKYLKKSEKEGASGHMMIVESAPVRKPADGKLRPYAITIIDCTSSPHANDSRGSKKDGGTPDTGVGRGTIQVYVDNDGNLAEWSWSDGKRMQHYDAQTRPITFARVPWGQP